MSHKSKNLNYFLKKTFVLFLIFTFTFGDILSFLPSSWQNNKLFNGLKISEASAAVIGDGVFIYDQISPTTNVQNRTWTNSTKSVGPATSPFAGSGTSKHIYAKGSQTRQEMLLGIQDSAGLLTIYMSNDDGATWTSQFTATVGDGNLKRFEIAYEQNSGDALVVYSANTGTTNEIKYQVWNGTSWTGALNLDPIRTSGTIYGIRAAERVGSNEIAIVWVDTNLDISANVWNGSSWYGEPAAALSTSISRSGGTAPSTVPTRRGYDLAFESVSGDLMVTWGDDSGSLTQVDPKYIIKTAGGAWGTATAITNLTEDGEMIDISASPVSDKIAFSTCSVDSGADCNSIIWSGTTWGTVVSDTSAATAITGESSNNVEWLIDGANEVAVITYSDAGGGGIDWYTSVNGATPVIQADNTATPAIAGGERAGFSKVNPADSREGIFIFEDSNSDIFVKRAYLTGTTVAWSNPTGLTTAIETAASVAGFNPVGFAFSRFVPTLNTTISDFVSAEPGNSTIAPGGSGLVDSFGLVTTSGTDTVTTATINLAAGMWNYIQTVAITNNGDTVTYCSATPTGDLVSLSSCNIPVTTTNTQFKIKITANPHSLMPSPPGGSYAVTAIINSYTSTKTQTGTDSGSSVLTIDNLSPNSATALSGSGGNAADTLNWTTSNSADFNTTGGSVIYRWASASAGSEVPVEGVSSNVIGNTNGTATIACVVSSNASTALTRIDGTGGSADCTTAALTYDQSYTYKIFQKGNNGNYDVGVVIGTFTPREPIVVSGYINSTETALNYSGSCTNCGARIGGGAGFRQTITITGSGFKTVAAGNRSTATNNIKVGTHQIADANITSWTPTSITFLTDSAVAGDTDANWGTVFGGASALTITVNSVVSSGLNFYLFPQVTSITVPTAVANAAREYNAADSDGLITLNGTRFGTAATGGWVRILGCDSATCASPTGSATTNSWSNTAITVQVPAVIADNIYTGSVIMQQGTGSTNKSHTYATTGFRILPRITSLSPTSGAVGAAVTVNGNHLCQNGGTCPTAYDANNKVTFTSTINTTVFTSWSSTAIVTAVPSGATDGVVSVTSNTYLSNNSAIFSVLSPIPSDPTSLNQFNDAALTLPLSVGDTSSSANQYLTMNMQADFSGGTLYPQVEYKPVGTAFACTTATSCASATEGAGVAGPGPINCSATANGCAITISPTDGVYHWQARTRHFSGGSSYYSNWVAYGGNSESATDFKIDKVGPVITFAGGDNCAGAVTNITTNGATISWTLNESATGQVEYSKNSSLSASTNSAISSSAYNHSFNLSNLDSGATYYFKVKSSDSAANTTNRPSVSPYCSFTTSSVTQPAKTTKFNIGSIPGILTGGTSTSSDFSVYVPENSVSVISAFVELTAMSPNWWTNNLTIAINGQATSTYVMESAANSFKVLYPISSSNLNFDPLSNVLYIRSDLDLNITSAELVLTYSFAP